jgi:chemotaxis signal transduction protein
LANAEEGSARSPLRCGILAHRGDILTVVNLASVLGSAETTKTPALVVLDPQGADERFVLAVDEVHGVEIMDDATRKPNPDMLDARTTAIFDGAYHGSEDLLVQLNLRRLSPDRVSELFCVSPIEDYVEHAHADCR